MQATIPLGKMELQLHQKGCVQNPEEKIRAKRFESLSIVNSGSYY